MREHDIRTYTEIDECEANKIAIRKEQKSSTCAVPK